MSDIRMFFSQFREWKNLKKTLVELIEDRFFERR